MATVAELKEAIKKAFMPIDTKVYVTNLSNDEEWEDYLLCSSLDLENLGLFVSREGE